MNNSPASLKPYLDGLLEKFDRSHLEPDPLAAADGYKDGADLEVALLFAALFAYGRADLIQKNAARILASMGPSPAGFVDDFKPSASRAWMKGFSYRFHRRADLVALAGAVGKARRRYGSLADLFLAFDDPCAGDILPGLSGMARTLRKLSGRNTPAFRSLLADPAEGSAAKRWNLYLRWMVRRDGVDPGPWSGRVARPRLVIPLDTHVGRIARLLGMLKRRSNDWKAAVELTDFLRRMDPDDPVKYDFAICSYGKLGYCVSRPDISKCRRCGLAPVCSLAS
ncbi:MAG: TIGR02757 family protein [Candidatus Nitrospinota bacterium M3_3B_026]